MPPTVIRRTVLVLVAALALLGSAAYAALKPDLSVAPSPASQIVSQGQAATYTVTLNRLNGLTAPVTLKVANLPTGVTPSWDGVARSSLSVAAGVNVVTLKLQTSASTRAGTTYPTITATSGSLTRLTALTMIVETSVSTRNFTLAALPASRTILQGRERRVLVQRQPRGRLHRPGQARRHRIAGRRRRDLAAARRHRGDRRIDPRGRCDRVAGADEPANTPTGSFPLVILGSGKPAAATITRFAAATLVVQPTLSFQIAGSPPRLLAPGVRAPLDLRLTNPYGFPVKVASLAVGVEEGTNRPGCSGTANFRATGPRVVGFVLPAQAEGVPLSTLIGRARCRPSRCSTRTPAEEACIDTAVTLQYSGSATR